MSNIRKLLYLVIGGLLLNACALSKIDPHEVIWVNSTKIPCNGVVPMHCMQIQKGNQLDQNNWSLFYSKIEGFEYTPGSIYKLKVSVISLSPDSIPADAPNKKYKLIKVISKTPDKKLNLNDIWMLTHLNGKTITIENINEIPRMEINLARKKIFGKGTCNRFNGSIKEVSKNILRFNEQIMSTRMMCKNMEFENTFFKILPKTNSYAIKKNQLSFFDLKNQEIAKFKKID